MASSPQDVLMTGAVGVVIRALKIDPAKLSQSVEGVIGAINKAAADIAAVRSQLDALADQFAALSARLERNDRELRPDARPGGIGNGHDPAALARPGRDRA